MKYQYKDIEISKIEFVDNPRATDKDTELEWLMESIKQHGLQSPIGVYTTPNKDSYILKWGSRRLSSFKKLGFNVIPAFITTDDMTEKELLVASTIENMHRKQLSTMELGRVCFRLKEENLTVGETAKRLSLPKGRVKTALSLYLNIPEGSRHNIDFHLSNTSKEGKIPASTMRKALWIKNRYQMTDSQFNEVVEHFRKEEATYRQVEMVGILMSEGMSAKKALEEAKKYKMSYILFPIKLEDVATLKTKYPNRTYIQTLRDKLKLVIEKETM